MKIIALLMLWFMLGGYVAFGFGRLTRTPKT